jgi:cytochrome P450
MPIRPPGPKPKFLIGNMPLASSNPLDVFTSWAREYGDVFYYRAAYIHVYFFNHPDLIDAVLVRHYQNFLKDRVLQNSRWFFGDGLLTSERDVWRKQRQLCQPAFHRERIASYASLMTHYAEDMLRGWSDGRHVDVHQEMMQLTLRIVVRTLFDVEVESTGEVSSALNVVMRNITGARMIFPPAFRFVPTPGMHRFRRAVKQLNQTVFGIISHRRKEQRDSGDLLSMLIRARGESGEQMNDQQLRDEVLTFLLAGHETTALALSWTWYLLSRNPAAEQKLHKELDDVLAGRLPTLDDLPRLLYTESIIKESLRMYPPAWSLARTVVSDFDIGGYTIPSGANVVLSQWVMHRDPRFFVDPESFNPERWRGDAQSKLPRFAYFPFGGGPRQCIGASFAMMEAVLLLATIARKFRVQVVDEEITPVPSFTLRPRNGVPAILRSRAQN